MAWLWLNIAICAPIFLAITGIPLWMVIRRPDTGPSLATYSAQGGAPQLHPALAAPGAAFPSGYAAAGAAAVPQRVAVAA